MGYIPIEERLPDLKKKFKLVFWEIDGDATNGGSYYYDKDKDLWMMYTRTNGKLNYHYTMKFIKKFMKDKFFFYKVVLFANYAHTENDHYNRILKVFLSESANKVRIHYTKNRAR